MSEPTGNLASAYLSIASLERQLEDLRAELATLKAGQGEAVAWLLHLPDGRSTLEKSFPGWAEGGDGYAIQPLYTAPPATGVNVPREFLDEAECCAFALENIGSLEPDDIDGDDIDLRFEDADGHDTGSNVSIVGCAERAAKTIRALLAQSQ